MAEAGPEPAESVWDSFHGPSCFLSVLPQAVLTSEPLNWLPLCQDLPTDLSGLLLHFWSLPHPQLKVIQDTPYSPDPEHLQDVNVLNPNARISGDDSCF